jgi:hypothetical protein
MGLGQFRGPSWLTENTSELPQSDLYRGARWGLSQRISCGGGREEKIAETS